MQRADRDPKLVAPTSALSASCRRWTATNSSNFRTSAQIGGSGSGAWASDEGGRRSIARSVACNIDSSILSNHHQALNQGIGECDASIMASAQRVTRSASEFGRFRCDQLCARVEVHLAKPRSVDGIRNSRGATEIGLLLDDFTIGALPLDQAAMPGGRGHPPRRSASQRKPYRPSAGPIIAPVVELLDLKDFAEMSRCRIDRAGLQPQRGGTNAAESPGNRAANAVLPSPNPSDASGQ